MDDDTEAVKLADKLHPEDYTCSNEYVALSRKMLALPMAH